MALTETENEAVVIGKLVANGNRYLISVTADYSEDLKKITSRRVLVKVSPLV